MRIILSGKSISRNLACSSHSDQIIFFHPFIEKRISQIILILNHLLFHKFHEFFQIFFCFISSVTFDRSRSSSLCDRFQKIFRTPKQYLFCIGKLIKSEITIYRTVLSAFSIPPETVYPQLRHTDIHQNKIRLKLLNFF